MHIYDFVYAYAYVYVYVYVYVYAYAYVQVYASRCHVMQCKMQKYTQELTRTFATPTHLTLYTTHTLLPLNAHPTSACAKPLHILHPVPAPSSSCSRPWSLSCSLP